MEWFAIADEISCIKKMVVFIYFIVFSLVGQLCPNDRLFADFDI